ncbi:MAG: hypothetical protein RI883_1557 [Bacteroidota bacterium]|jgi:hypothetical protein
MLEKVAIVEFGGSHDECLMSQFIALKEKGCYVVFVSTQEMYDRNVFFHNYIDEFISIQFTGKALKDFSLMRKLNADLKSKGISKVILNTAQGAHVRNLCLTAPKSIEFIGLVHTLKKFQGSFTQKLINFKIKKYLVLNDFFLTKIDTPKGIQIASFYPLRFPDFDTEIEKKTGEKWITIIGGVENRRKDLIGSIPLMQELVQKGYRFIFLGKSDFKHPDVIYFNQFVKDAAIEKDVKLFDSFVSAEQFDAYLKVTDLIWPMVHPHTPSAVEYFKNQISGAMNVSFAYKIPMLVHQDYMNQWQDFSNSISYNYENFSIKVIEGFENKEMIERAIRETEKFDPRFQEKKYLKFIFEN